MREFLRRLTGLKLPFVGGISWRPKDFDGDLYERRKRLFDEVEKFFFRVTRDCRPQPKDLMGFHPTIREARFLFGKDLTSYLRRVLRNAASLATLTQKLDNPKLFSHEERSSWSAEETRVSTWFGEQHEELPEKFAPYMEVA